MINPKVKLNHMQEVAVEMYADYYRYPHKRKRPWFEINGAAGTGKTTVIREAMEYLGIDNELTAFMAYVGKATLALRMNGLNAKTIHSTIYDLVLGYARDEHGEYILDAKGNKILRHQFELKPFLEPNYQQLVIDEGGMVGAGIGQDILSYHKPTMVLGDLAQLPPVMAKRIFLEAPDVTLTEIMRQEKDSPIIYLSQKAKMGEPIKYGIYGSRECMVIPKRLLTDEMLAEADIVICETNMMRDNINRYMRKNIQGIEEPYIVPGDKLVCRQNKWTTVLDEDVSLVNGLIGYVQNTYKESKHGNRCLMDIDFRPEFYKSKHFKKIGIDHKNPFLPYNERKEKKTFGGDSPAIFEFANCITCHLSQGSQYDTVLVYVEHGGNSLYFKQWLYTAITRAKKKLILVI